MSFVLTNNTVASVDADGFVTALAVGDTKLKVSARQPAARDRSAGAAEEKAAVLASDRISIRVVDLAETGIRIVSVPQLVIGHSAPATVYGGEGSDATPLSFYGAETAYQWEAFGEAGVIEQRLPEGSSLSALIS